MEKPGALNKPVKSNASVVKLILERIEEALMKKELRPGDRLPSESELTRGLNVGKSSVREAAKMLEAMGVVDIRQGDGTYIRKQPTVDSINTLIFSLYLEEGTSGDLLDLRVMFEPAYTIMAMNRATPEDIEEIGNSIKRLEEKTAQGIQDADDDLAFHRAILRSTHNNFVIRIGEAILGLFKASMDKSVKSIPHVSIRDHKEIYEAFCEKNETKLRSAINKSFEGWMKTL